MNDCTITLRACSTKEDPTWVLGSFETEIVILLWDSLESDKPFEHLIPAVGYRGFEVNYQGNIWLVYGEHVRLIQNAHGPQYRIDKDQLLENFLIGNTSPKICQEVKEQIETDCYLNFLESQTKQVLGGKPYNR